MAQKMPSTWERRPPPGGPPGGGFGGGSPFALTPPPRDIGFLLAALFLTFTLSAFRTTALWVFLLQLTPAVYKLGLLWQVLTYPFAAEFSGFFFLFVLLMVNQFGSEVFLRLGRKEFWRVFLLATTTGGVAAVLTQIALEMGQLAERADFTLIQGDRIVLVVLTALYATLFPNRTLLLFFILPVQARMLLWIELVIGFVFLLTTKDFAGFVGLAVAIAVAYSWLTGRGPRRFLDELERKFAYWRARRRYEKLKKKSGLRVVGKDDPWVN